MSGFEGFQLLMTDRAGERDQDPRREEKARGCDHPEDHQLVLTVPRRPSPRFPQRDLLTEMEGEHHTLLGRTRFAVSLPVPA